MPDQLDLHSQYKNIRELTAAYKEICVHDWMCGPGSARHDLVAHREICSKCYTTREVIPVKSYA